MSASQVAEAIWSADIVFTTRSAGTILVVRILHQSIDATSVALRRR